MDEEKRLPGQPKPYCGELPSLASVNIREAELHIVTDNLKQPWAFEFINKKSIIISEFGGEIKVLNLANEHITNISGLPEISAGVGQRGLLDIAIHPDFSKNKIIYFSYVGASDTNDGYVLKLARAVLAENKLLNVTDIFTALPYAERSSNFGGAILFDASGHLLFSTGDRSYSNNSKNTKKLHGKIVRLHDDGSIPADNPYINDPDFHPAIYAYGVRNPQGLALDQETGVVYETEHGPMGGDEVNIISPRVNYGWPDISYGMNYVYLPMGTGKSSQAGMKQPLFYYLPSRAVSPIEVYRGNMFPEWNGDLLVGALRARSVSKIDIVDQQVKSESTILSEVNGRVRDIKTASDGSIYIIVENGILYRLSRNTEPKKISKPGKRIGIEVYELACKSCHSHNSPGTPQIGEVSVWQERLKKGNFTLKVNAINGYKGMPAMGNCTDCTRREIGLAVEHILTSSQ
jgi:glucose/arabinose dehydrogenase